MPEVCGWHLVDELALYPVLSEMQTAVQDKVVFQDGKWAMTYRIVETLPYEEAEGIDFKARCEMLEKALADLAHIVSSLVVLSATATASVPGNVDSMLAGPW